MERELPPWQSLEPEAAGDASLPLGDSVDSGRIIAVLATPGASEDDWASRMVVELARGWTRRSERVLLADLNLNKPSLHEVLGVTNGEGVSDVVLWGASFQRVAHVVEAGLLFASAGTVVADPTPVLTSARWSAITDGFQRAEATLIAYMPIGITGRQDLLERVSDIVLLARQEEAPHLDLGDLGDRVRAVIGPDPHGARRAAAAAAASPRRSFAAAPVLESVDEAPGRPSLDLGASSRRGMPIGIMVAAAVVAVFFVAWSGLVEVPGLTPLLRGGGDAVATPATVAPDGPAGEETPEVVASEGAGNSAEAEEPAADLPPVEVNEETPPATAANLPPRVSIEVSGPTMAFALQMAAYPSLQTAIEQGEDVEARVAGSSFVIAPVEVQGTVYYRLLIASAESQAALDAERATLGAGLGVSPAQAGGWISQPTGLAFHLGDAPTRRAADAQIRDLVELGVPAYALAVTAEGRPAFRVYAGAFRSPAEARFLEGVLAGIGLADAPLVQRVGTLSE